MIFKYLIFNDYVYNIILQINILQKRMALDANRLTL